MERRRPGSHHAGDGALGGGWITLAAVTIPGYAWAAGIPILLGSGLALLHASHTFVVRIEERLPRALGRLLELLFVYRVKAASRDIGGIL